MSKQVWIYHRPEPLVKEEEKMETKCFECGGHVKDVGRLFKSSLSAGNLRGNKIWLCKACQMKKKWKKRTHGRVRK